MDPCNLIFFVNGTKVEIKEPSIETTLLQFLRRNLLLTGTKEACGQGGCGAFTVMVSKYDFTKKKIINISANACLIPLCYLHGMAVTTVEGVGSTRNGLHPIQKQLVESHGMQCGFCTPGIVMTMYTQLKNNHNPGQELIERVLEGNLCRCTGYRPIVDAFKKCACGLDASSCCKTGSGESNCQEKEIITNGPQNDTTQDPIFPSELQLNKEYQMSTVTFKSNGTTWIRPTSLRELCEFKSRYTQAPIVMGCTAIGYLMRKGKMKSDVVICGTNVQELQTIKATESGIVVGAAVTMATLEETVLLLQDSVSTSKWKILTSLLKCLRWIGADQIRNIATVGGHIMSHAPNLDLQVFLMAAAAKLTFVVKDFVEKKLTYDENVINDGMRTENSILLSVTIPYLDEVEYLSFMKQPHRRGFDYAIINTGMYVKLRDGTDIIDDIRMAFGGVGSKPRILGNLLAGLAGMKWNADFLCRANDVLVQELGRTDMDNIKFKIALACGFLYKFYVEVDNIVRTDPVNVSQADLDMQYSVSKGSQVYDNLDGGPNFAVWKPLPHYAGESIVSGEAVYLDDIPAYQNEVFIAYVMSKKAHASILSVDTSEALKLPGVVDYIDHTDVPGQNNFGLIVPDSELFAVGKVSCYGQVVGAIAATTREIARKAVQHVEIEYEELDAVFTNKEAIEKGSFYDFTDEIKQGDTENGLRNAQFTIEGEIEIGSQEHMYMETQAVLAVPKREQNEIEVIAGTQAPCESQMEIAKFLGIPANRIVVKCKRIGGAFGGKNAETMYHLGASVVTAWKLNRPVRCYLDRDTDMRITGKRHPILAKYKAGFREDGKITTVDIDFYVNAGHFRDTSPFIIYVVMIHISGSYNFENFRAKGYLTKTNIPSNTAVRGFGGPQSVFIIENIINDVALYLGKDKTEVCEINMYKEGDITPTHKELTKLTLPRCWTECKEDSKYVSRRKAITEVNKNNRYKKRGIAMMPLMFPIGYAPLFLNQAGALLHVYLDGSVLLTHGGTEMGQGINTKMIQVAGTALDVPIDKIYINETSTNTVPNGTETGGSAGNDVNAGAVLNACEVLSERLAPYKKAKPRATWEEWVHAAYMDRVSLSVAGFYKLRDIGYDFSTHTGVPCTYFTYGVACSEVEIDCLTGEHQILRADIVMDVGKSLNPAVDVGQVEGGFMMGCGLVTMEQLRVDSSGRISNSGPVDYKIPTVRNIPREFNVKLLKECNSGVAVYSSKGTGEPPLLLAISIHQALKDAILAARRESGLFQNIRLDSPLTVERIRLACEDDIIKKCDTMTGKDTSTQIPL